MKGKMLEELTIFMQNNWKENPEAGLKPEEGLPRRKLLTDDLRQ